MKTIHKLFLALIPVLGLAACGGGDTEDRLDVTDPVVRFVQASPLATGVTLYRADVAQPDATNTTYGFASDYFDIDTGVADWSAKTATSTLGSVSIDPERGTKYTIVSLAASATDNTVALIVDPYNKTLTSDSTRLRLMNASYNAASVDLYMLPPNTDINTVTAAPLIGATAFKASGPLSGVDSTDIPAGTYQVTVTAAGTKTVLFNGQLSFAANKDLLLLTVPDATQPGGINVLVKTEGVAGASAVPAL